MRKIQETRLKNALKNWHTVKNPLIVLATGIIFYFNRFNPFLGLKNEIYNLFGTKIHKNARLAFGVWVDFFFPELIEINDGAVVGLNSTILTHEFLPHSWRKGRVSIGKNVLIGANSTIMPGVSIEENSLIGAMSLVNKDIPANELWGGVPVRKIK
ncbi:acyltransferase [Candidatus Micrarchaeota archaeon]|nr:acyltransferase [Candidatus Micrarchaeota archaeon]